MRISTPARVAPLVCLALLAASSDGVSAREVRAASVSEETLERAQAYYHLMRAELAASERRTYDALREARSAVAKQPESASVHAEAAAVLLRLRQRSEAERMARRALELDPDERVALRVLADLAVVRASGPRGDAESRETAIRLYERLAESPDADAEVLLMLAQLKLRAGDTAGAAGVARRLTARRPGDASVVAMLSHTLVLDGKPEEALDVLLQFLQTNPVSEDLLGAAERLVRETGGWDHLERACARILATSPEHVAARRLRGEALLELARAHEAAVELEKARELAPDDPSVQFNLGRAYWAAGRLADAVALGRRLVEEYPRAFQLRLVLGEALYRQGEVDAAVASLSAALEQLGNDPSVRSIQRDRLRVRIATMLLDSDRVSEAVQRLEELEDPEQEEFLEIRAESAVRAGDLRVARTLARKLPRGPAALIEAQILLAEGEAAKAMARFDTAVAVLGTSGRLRAQQLLRDHGEKDKAERFLREWVETEGDRADARFALGSFLERTGRFPEAEGHFRRALNLEPDHAAALNYLGYSLADRNERLDEALQLIQKALEIDPWNGAYLDSLGWVYFRMGRFEEARDPLERAAREFPRDPTVLEHLGDLYEQLGDREAAQKAWRRALDAGPEDADGLRLKLRRSEAPGAERTEGSSGRDQASGPRGGLRGPLPR